MALFGEVVVGSWFANEHNGHKLHFFLRGGGMKKIFFIGKSNCIKSA